MKYHRPLAAYRSHTVRWQGRGSEKQGWSFGNSSESEKPKIQVVCTAQDKNRAQTTWFHSVRPGASVESHQCIVIYLFNTITDGNVVTAHGTPDENVLVEECLKLQHSPQCPSTNNSAGAKEPLKPGEQATNREFFDFSNAEKQMYKLLFLVDSEIIHPSLWNKIRLICPTDSCFLPR